MPFGTDYRQAIILAVENQGEQAVNQLRASLKVVEEQIAGWNRALEAGTTATTTHIAAVARLVQVQGDLKAAIEVTREAEGAALRERAEGYARAERAAEELAEREKQAAGEALRAKIDAYARAERAAMDAAEREKEAAGEALRARIDALARAERAEAQANSFREKINKELHDQDIVAMGERARAYARQESQREEAARRTAQADGDALRARIEGYARAERAAEAAAAAQKQADGDAMRAKIDAIARAERAAMDAAAAQKQADGDALRARIEGYARAEQAQEQADRDRLASLKKVHAAMIAVATGQTAVTTATASAGNTLGGYASKADAAAGATKGASYAFLNLAHAMQDAQYGFGAVLNNIPLVVQGMGGSAGLAGTIMVAGVAINTVMPHMEEFGKSIGALRDPLKDATGDLAGMTEKMAALEAKPFKVSVDYDAIRALRIEIRESQKAIAEWEALKGRDTQAKGSAKEVIDKGIVEGGGPDAFENAVLEIKKRDGTFGAGSELHGQLSQQKALIKLMDSFIKNMGEGSIQASPFSIARRLAYSRIDDIKEEMEREARQNIGKMRSLRFGEGSRQAMEDILMDPKNQDILRKHGVTNEAKLGVVMASPWNMQAVGRDRVRDENDRKERVETEKAVEDAVKDAEALSRKIAGEQNRDAEATAREGKQDRGLEGRIRAKNERDAAAAARKDDANAKRQEREAPKVADHARDMGFAQTIQANTGIPDAMANEAGRQAGAMVEKGANPVTAMNIALRKVLEVAREQQAAMEHAAGVLGPATMEIEMLRQRARAVNQNMRRMGNQRPTRNITFGP